VPRERLIVRRERTAGGGMREEVEIANFGDAEAAFALELRIGADFAHIFEVKRAVEVPPSTTATADLRSRVGRDRRSLTLRDPRDERSRSLRVQVSEPAGITADALRFDVRLARRARWRLSVDCEVPVPTASRDGAHGAARGPHPNIQVHRDHRQHEMIEGAPALVTDSTVLRGGYEQCVADFARLCIAGEEAARGEYVIAAGIPWFMTLFRRDSLIAGYQSLRCAIRRSARSTGSTATATATATATSSTSSTRRSGSRIRAGRTRITRPGSATDGWPGHRSRCARSRATRTLRGWAWPIPSRRSVSAIGRPRCARRRPGFVSA